GAIIGVGAADNGEGARGALESEGTAAAARDDSIPDQRGGGGLVEAAAGGREQDPARGVEAHVGGARAEAAAVESDLVGRAGSDADPEVAGEAERAAIANPSAREAGLGSA